MKCLRSLNIRYRDIAQAEADATRPAEGAAWSAQEDRASSQEPDPRRGEGNATASRPCWQSSKKDKRRAVRPLFVGVRDLFNASPGLLDALSRQSRRRRAQGCGRSRMAHRPASRMRFALQGGADDRPADDRRRQAAAPVVIDTGAADRRPMPTADSADTAAKAKAEQFPDRGRRHRAEMGALSKMFFAAIGEAQSMKSLAMLVLPLLAAGGRSARTPTTSRRAPSTPGNSPASCARCVDNGRHRRRAAAAPPHQRSRSTSSRTATPTARRSSSASTCPTSRTPPKSASFRDNVQADGRR